MYNFLFNFFYRYYKQKKELIFKESAALNVALAIVFQSFCIIAIFRYYFGINLFPIKQYSVDYFTNKWHFAPYMLIYLAVFVIYYTDKRAIKIVSKYPEDYKFMTIRNVILVFTIMFLPLIVGLIIFKVKGN